MSLLKLNKFFTISIITALSLTTADASSCEKRVFNLKINEQVSVQEILTQLSDMCHFSVVTKDQFAKDAISEPLFGINIKDKTLNEASTLLNDKRKERENLINELTALAKQKGLEEWEARNFAYGKNYTDKESAVEDLNNYIAEKAKRKTKID